MITVIFATLNRATLLAEVLTSFAKLRSPQGGWRLVVADNGSTDRTHDVVESFRARLPIDYVFAAQPGKNAALNAALELMQGELIVFTDDDVFPRADWLLRMQAAASAQPTCSVFGGAIIPRWAEIPQDWLLQWVPRGPVFSITEPGAAEGPVGSDRIFGPNMAVRAAVFRDGIRFDSSIGPRGASYPMGSETEFVERLLRNGHKAWFVPDAIVEHFVRSSQMQKRWVFRRAVHYGRGQYRLTVAPQSLQTKDWAGVPRYLVRRLAGELAKMVLAAITVDARRLFDARWNFNYLRGEAIEARALHRARRATVNG
jgi:glycosyltransferase involved in cell wall biosynthesis